MLMYGHERFKGEALMNAAVDEAVAQNREACRIQDQRYVCWLFREEINRQQEVRHG